MAWGSNVFGQLGLPHVNKQSIVPLQIPREVGIVVNYFLHL